MEIQEAVKIVTDYIRKTGKSQSEAIRKLSKNHLHTLSAGAKEQLWQEGLQARVGNALTSGWRVSLDSKSLDVSVTVESSGQEMSLEILVDTFFGVAEGLEKPLINFTDSDFSYCIERNNSQIQGLRKRNEAFEFGRGQLSIHKVNVVSKLPFKAKEKFANVWSGVAQGKEPEGVPIAVSRSQQNQIGQPNL